MHLNSDHYFFTSWQQVDQLVRPLQLHFGITSFIYQKNYADGREIRLSNQPVWLAHFFEAQLYTGSVFETDPKHYQKMRIVWAGLPKEHNTILARAREFQIDHGITFVEPVADGCEFFFLGTRPERHDVMPRYLTHLDLIEQFLAYFRERAAPLMAEATRNAIMLPGRPTLLPEQWTTPLLDRPAFQAMVNPLQAALSPREQECLALLLKGYTVKMIAQTLQLSPRTIETYLESLKLKTNAHTKGELIRKFGKL